MWVNVRHLAVKTRCAPEQRNEFDSHISPLYPRWKSISVIPSISSPASERIDSKVFEVGATCSNYEVLSTPFLIPARWLYVVNIHIFLDSTQVWRLKSSCISPQHKAEEFSLIISLALVPPVILVETGSSPPPTPTPTGSYRLSCVAKTRQLCYPTSTPKSVSYMVTWTPMIFLRRK